MTLRNSLILSLITGLLGVAGGYMVQPAAPPQVSQSQGQQQAQGAALSSQNDCVAEVGKKTNADGSVEDFFRFRAAAQANLNANQNQSASQTQAVSPQKPTIDIFSGGGLSSEYKGYGSLEAIAGRHSFEYLTNGSEQIGLYKFKVISF